MAAVAGVCGVSLCPVRNYDEVAADPGWSGPAVTFDPGDSADTASGARRSVPGAAVGFPLEGIGVVEATNRMQGPLAGLLLQLLGAVVTRVEPPGGDVGRMVPPECDGTSSFFQCFNRDKRSVELDLTSPSGRRNLLELMAGADVFLHNWRPGRAEAWQLDQPAMAAVNPGLVYAAASGWGPSGGFDGVIGTDFLVQAHAGFGEGLNPAGEPPRTSRVLLADCLGALCTCEAILAGLYLREAAGAGNILARPSLLEGALAAQAHILDSLGEGGKRGGRSRARPQWSPLDGPLRTSTGEQVVVGVEAGAERDQLAEICSRSPSASDDVLVEAINRRPAEDWMEELAAAQIPCARVVRALASLPAEPGMARYFSNLSATCRGPASPWSFE
ncbi:MAG: CoA transferase [Acidimicrobiales bacterium]